VGGGRVTGANRRRPAWESDHASRGRLRPVELIAASSGPLGWAEGFDHVSLVSSVFRHLAGTTTSTAPSAVLGARNPDSERAHCVPPCVSGPSYRASIQLSDPTSLTAAFEKDTRTGAPSAVPRWSAEKRGGPAVL